ncbi:MAG: gliding motility-associated C-terminal domain-containing protein [Candidatus Zixiibacteriota bacterium]
MIKILKFIFLLCLFSVNLLALEFALEPLNSCFGENLTVAFTVSDLGSDELNFVAIKFSYTPAMDTISYDLATLPTETWFPAPTITDTTYSFTASDLTGMFLVDSPCTLAIFNLGTLESLPIGTDIDLIVTGIRYEVEGTGSTLDYDITGFSHPSFTVEDCSGGCDLNTILSASDSLICGGGQVNLYADAGAYDGTATFLWQPAEFLDDSSLANPLAMPESTTVFRCSTWVSDSCIDLDSIVIEAYPAIEIGLDDTIVCRDEFITLGIENDYESYEWSTGDINFRISFMADFTEDRLYWLEVTDINGCTARDSFIVRTNPCPDCGLTVEDIPDTSTCRGESVDIAVDAGSLQDRCFYLWEPDLFISDARSDNPTFTPDTSIEYTLYVTYNRYCRDTQNVKISVYPLEPLNFGFDDTTVCKDRLIEFTSPNEYSSYEWNHDPTEDGRSIYLLTDFDSQYVYLEVTDSTGCTDFDSFMVYTRDCADSCNLIADMVSDQAICRGDYVDLWVVSADTTLSYSWYPPEAVMNPYEALTVATPDTTTIFRVIARKPGICSDTGYVEITVGPEIEIDIEDLVECRNDTVLIFAPEGYEHYIWSTGDDSRGIEIITDFTSQEFWIRAIDEHGCMESDTFTITTTICDTFECRLDVSIRTKLDSVYICRGDSLELSSIVRHAEGEPVYSWTPQENIIHPHLPNAIVFPTQTTNYMVTVEDDSLCVAMDTIKVNVYTCRPSEKVECLAHPKPFTPNDDGINDNLYLRYPGMADEAGIAYIYNINNVLVRQIERGEEFISAEGSIIWDGKDNNGSYLQNGPYLYIIKVGDETICKGTAYIAR